MLVQSASPHHAVGCKVPPGLSVDVKCFHVSLAEILLAQLWVVFGSPSRCQLSIENVGVGHSVLPGYTKDTADASQVEGIESFSSLASVVHVLQPYISVLTTQTLYTTILVFNVSVELVHTREVRRASVATAFPLLLSISVLALRRPRLKSLSSDLGRRQIPSDAVPKACHKSRAKKIPKSVWARMHPCLTLLSMSKGLA